jgi:voltage-gated potassium channel Kch
MARRGVRRVPRPGRAGSRQPAPLVAGSPSGQALSSSHGPADAKGVRSRAAAYWQAVRWPIAVGAAAAAVALGMVGFTDHYTAAGVRLTGLDAFYRSLQLFVLEWGGLDAPVPVTLQAARLLAPLVAGFAAAQALAVLFRDELERLRLRFLWRGHVLVCGLGTEGGTLARSLVAGGWKVAAIERDLRPRARADGIVVLAGDATEAAVLARAGAARAAHVVAVCGTDDTNAAVARAARAVGGPALVIHLHLRDARLAALLRTEALADPSGAGRGALEFFTVDEHAARKLLDTLPPFGAEAGELVIVGLNRFGASLAVEAARRGVQAGLSARVTIVDAGAAAGVADLLRRHPGMGEAAAFTGLSVGPASAEFDEAHFLVDEAGRCRARAIVICLEDEEQGLSAGLTLRQRLKGVPAPECPIDLVVCTVHASSLADLVAASAGGEAVARFRTLNPIGASLDASLLTLGTREAIAAALHASYVASRPADAPGGPPPAWADLDEETREANRAAADGIGPGLRSVGCDLIPLVAWDTAPMVFTPAEVELMAILEHRRWVAWKQAHGFRFGDVSDPARRTNAHLVPWDRLGESTRESVRTFVRSYPRVLADAGQQVVRLDRSPARALHDCYVARRTAAGETPTDNPSLVAWDLLPEHLKASNRDQMAHLRVKLMAVGRDLAPGADGPDDPLTPADIELLAEMEHRRWCEHERFGGWSLGPRKDAEAKTTPYLVPWEVLPEEMRDIDREFARAIPDLVRRMGQRIVRVDE